MFCTCFAIIQPLQHASFVVMWKCFDFCTSYVFYFFITFFFYISNIFLHLMYFIDTQSTTIKDHLIFNFSSELLKATLLHRLRPVSLTNFISREPYLWVIIGRTLEGLTAVENRRAESDFCRPNPFSG